MAELREEQLLLLDNLMYFNKISGETEGLSVYQVAKMMKDAAASGNSGMFQGGLESDLDNVVKIADAILADDSLKDLDIATTTNANGIRAACFVDSNGEATVAIRGTGGSFDAWRDNFVGLAQTDTAMQQEIAKFVNENCKEYSNITITGHSKGGNLAQYATVVCGDKIDRCISYDGQGFNDDFLSKYSSEIAKNKGKIKSICGANDYVNILLNPIAGEIVYLPAASGGMTEYHRSSDLYMTAVDDEGIFKGYVNQNQLIKQVLSPLIGDLVNVIDGLPSSKRVPLANCLGDLVGVIMAISGGNSISESDIKRMIGDAFEGLIAVATGLGLLDWLEYKLNMIKLKADLIYNLIKYCASNKEEEHIIADSASRDEIRAGRDTVFGINITTARECKEEIKSVCSELLKYGGEVLFIPIKDIVYASQFAKLAPLNNKIMSIGIKLNHLENAIDESIKMYGDAEAAMMN